MQGTIERAWTVAGRWGRHWLGPLSRRASTRVQESPEPPVEPPPPDWEQWIEAEPLHITGYTLRPDKDHPRSLACEERGDSGWCRYEALFARICPNLVAAEAVADAELYGKRTRGWILGERRLVVPIRVDAGSVYDLRGALTAAQARWVYDELYAGDGETDGRAAWDLARREPRCEGILLPTEPLTLFLFVDSFSDVVEERDDEAVSVGASRPGLRNVLDFVASMR